MMAKNIAKERFTDIRFDLSSIRVEFTRSHTHILKFPGHIENTMNVQTQHKHTPPTQSSVMMRRDALAVTKKKNNQGIIHKLTSLFLKPEVGPLVWSTYTNTKYEFYRNCAALHKQ